MYIVYIGCKPKKIVMRTQIIQKMSSDKSKLTNLLKQNTLSCVVDMKSEKYIQYLVRSLSELNISITEVLQHQLVRGESAALLSLLKKNFYLIK